MICTHCGEEIPDRSIVCPFCATSQAEAPTSLSPGDGANFDDAVTSIEVPTSAPASAITSAATGGSPATMSTSGSSHHGRFLPGTTVAERYRIVGLLGRGGMGEVYRADDLKLGQQVALKFLPGRMVADDEHVRRLFDEVRMARKVSHPNVCRVFDVGETDGQHYVSMEYVDGEDLSSLLRRIGRLPEDKAVEISRQLCAALAAAHDEGVLHRDLKPANIMLDGRGRVKLTDFGLAAVAEVRAGTPIYMAPEQLAGTEVSVKSDIYSLGLVLHELFTGKRVFEADDFNELSRLHEEGLSTSLAGTTQLDLSVDRVIHRCLERDPAKRPASALAVAAGLPGADPLAAALAAGETPSPEMVAEAGGKGSLSLAIATPLLLFALIGALVVGYMQSQQSLTGWVPMDMSPALLDARAVEILEELGYPTTFVDTASGFNSDQSYLTWLRGEESTPERLELVAQGRTSTVHYWWRGSPVVLVPGLPNGVGIGGSVAISRPARTTPGMMSMLLDTKGRLIWFDVVPEGFDLEPLNDTGPDGAPTSFEWAPVFELMGLDMATFERVPPRLTPEHFADERAAWQGAYPENPDAPLRVEAAALRGRPIAVRLFTPDAPLAPPAPPVSLGDAGFGLATAVAALLIISVVALLLTAVFGGLYVAQRNMRTGRGDKRGARRLGYVVAVGLGISWLLGDHTYSPNDVNAFIQMLIFVGATGGLTWALYLAVEPFMRRHSPEALIGWARFMDGRFGDHLVGRDLLYGCAAGVLAQLLSLIPLALGGRAETAGNYIGLPISAASTLVSSVLSTAIVQLLLALGLSFLYGLSYLAVGRRPWAAFSVWLVFLASPGWVGGLIINNVRPSATYLTAIFWTLGWALFLFVLFRLGILVFLTMSTTAFLLAVALPTLDFGAWYGSSLIAGLMLFFGVTIYAFYRSVAWKGGFVEGMVND
jgi:serine/threonine-protein kinase